jgi:hypothetical protein
MRREPLVALDAPPLFARAPLAELEVFAWRTAGISGLVMAVRLLGSSAAPMMRTSVHRRCQAAHQGFPLVESISDPVKPQ